MKRLLLPAACVVAALAVLATGATLLHLEVPEPTGDYPVGRTRLSWTDQSRPETHTEDPSDKREVVATLWFPAQAGTGARGGYVERLSRTADGLVASGELSRAAVRGLRFVRDPARVGAEISPAKDSYPVVVLSPGNLTNVEFYASIAEDLASHGYLVVGIDHPYQVAAVELAGGKVAVYDAAAGEGLDAAAGKVRERVADLRFALDHLAEMKAAGDGIGRRIDLGRIGVMGHSNGGIAAVETCRAEPALGGCLNLDGQMAGGPFSYDADAGAPEQPFMYLTKEVDLHPALAARFEAGGAGTYRVVVPSAAHDHFADGALFKPTLNPFDRTPDDVITVVRGFTRSFFDHALLGKPEKALGRVAAPTDVYVNVYPLGGRPSIPQPA
jgi:dienelactone hydrolase